MKNSFEIKKTENYGWGHSILDNFKEWLIKDESELGLKSVAMELQFGILIMVIKGLLVI